MFHLRTFHCRTRAHRGQQIYVFKIERLVRKIANYNLRTSRVQKHRFTRILQRNAYIIVNVLTSGFIISPFRLSRIYNGSMSGPTEYERGRTVQLLRIRTARIDGVGRRVIFAYVRTKTLRNGRGNRAKNYIQKSYSLCETNENLHGARARGDYIVIILSETRGAVNVCSSRPHRGPGAYAAKTLHGRWTRGALDTIQALVIRMFDFVRGKANRKYDRRTCFLDFHVA